MDLKEHISTEIIQYFSSSEAWDYQLVPYERVLQTLHCYGKEKHDYTQVIQEIKIIFNIEVSISYIESDKFDEIFNSYYRGPEKKTEGINVSNIADSDFINLLIAEADSVHSSDIHIEPYEERCRVRIRIDGKLIERYIIDKNNYPALVNKTKIIANLDISEKRLPQDGRILFQKDSKKFDVRVSVLPTIYGEKIVLRLLTRNQELLDLRKLGFSEKQYNDYTKSILNPHGLILITGPTGSGKSTTLYATLRMLNKEDNNILTIEDPVEYTLAGVNQVQLKEEIGLTFGSALRTFLRQDPDIIMLGEIRDQDTAQMAIRSSLTGHLLLSTIHTNSAWGSISRLIDMGIHPYLISDTLKVCVAQRLVRILCPHCKTSHTIDQEVVSALGIHKTDFFKAKGCKECYYTGYIGRQAIYEVVLIDSFLANAIRKNELNVEDYFKKKKINTLKDSALLLLEQGSTSLEEIWSIINGVI